MTKDNSPAIDFDVDELAAEDTAEFVVHRPDGTPTGWVWTIAGPGHPASIALAERVSAEALRRSRAQEQARVNGKKWKGDEETADEVMRRMAGYMADRVLSWHPAEIKWGGKPFPCTRDNVISILLDPKRGSGIFRDLNAFFEDERSFMKRSENS